jgi:hypothetical protein
VIHPRMIWEGAKFSLAWAGMAVVLAVVVLVLLGWPQ